MADKQAQPSIIRFKVLFNFMSAAEIFYGYELT